MKTLKLSVLIFPLLTFFPQLSDAQERQMMKFDASTSLMLQELQALLVMDGDEIKVEALLGQNETKKGIDQLEQGDIILMMNGKRASSIEVLRTIYNGIEPDQEIKVGVRRNDERFIVNAIKGDAPKDGPRMMTMTFDTSEGEPLPSVVPELGAVLVDRNNEVVIEGVIPQMQPEALKPLEIEDHIIKELNGEKPKSANLVREFLEALAVGTTISITFEKDGNEQKVEFSKPKSRGNFSIVPKNN